MAKWDTYSDGTFEYKYTGSGKLLIRQAGQTDEYPHFTVEFDSNGVVKDFHSSDSRFGNRFGQNEVIAAALAYLRGVGLL
ncbi:MAG: hypothetical protein F6K21_12845 [Symploca sp. SIO2D2]|nr:hypothetical protein [Symploca sp. SIO2D2]